MKLKTRNDYLDKITETIEEYNALINPDMLEIIQAVEEMVNSSPMLEAIQAVQETVRLTAPSIKFIESMQHSAKMLSRELEPLFIQTEQILREINRYVPKLVGSELVSAKERRQTQDLSLRKLGFQNIYNIDDIGEDLIDYYEEEIKNLSLEEKEELSVAIESVISKPQNWQINLMSWLDKFKENNPFLSKLFVYILTVITSVIVGVIVNSITIGNDIKLREEPNTNSPIIITITQNQTVYIVGQKPYYYNIEFENIETGEKFNGWCSKRSVKWQENSDIQVEEDIVEKTPE